MQSERPFPWGFVRSDETGVVYRLERGSVTIGRDGTEDIVSNTVAFVAKASACVCSMSTFCRAALVASAVQLPINRMALVML